MSSWCWKCLWKKKNNNNIWKCMHHWKAYFMKFHNTLLVKIKNFLYYFFSISFTPFIFLSLTSVHIEILKSFLITMFFDKILYIQINIKRNFAKSPKYSEYILKLSKLAHPFKKFLRFISGNKWYINVNMVKSC